MAYSVPPSSEPSIALFSQSGPEVLVSGDTILGFDTNAMWNSPIVVNTYSAGPDNSTFTIGASGLYDVEANITIAANGATWSTPNQVKTFSIIVTRNGTTNTIAGTTANILSGANYSLHLSVVFPFLVGDTIQFNHNGTLTAGSPTALGLLNTFDLNTWVVFQYIKSV